MKPTACAELRRLIQALELERMAAGIVVIPLPTDRTPTHIRIADGVFGKPLGAAGAGLVVSIEVAGLRRLLELQEEREAIAAARAGARLEWNDGIDSSCGPEG